MSGTTPTTVPAPDLEPPAVDSPPVENPAGDGDWQLHLDDWRLRLTDADRSLIVTLCAEQHARRRPLHREARDLQHRLEGTTTHA